MKFAYVLLALPALVAQSIVDLAVATPSLSTLTAVLTMADYKPVLTALSGQGPFTVFAPTNEAFAAAGVDVTNVAAVTDVLKYHVLSGKVAAGDLAASQAPAMLNGARAIVKSGPKGVTVAGANVVLADVMATNGVVHVIDKVILPPSKSVVELAVATEAVSTLVSVLTMPQFKGVLDALSGEGPFTVFAPTNAAFAAAGVDVSDVEAVAAVLKYHVLSGAVYSDDLAASQDVATLNGAKVSVKKSASGVTVNSANVVVADVAGTNGVVHVIDAVLLPPAAKPAVAATSSVFWNGGSNYNTASTWAPASTMSSWSAPAASWALPTSTLGAFGNNWGYGGVSSYSPYSFASNYAAPVRAAAPVAATTPLYTARAAATVAAPAFNYGYNTLGANWAAPASNWGFGGFPSTMSYNYGAPVRAAAPVAAATPLYRAAAPVATTNYASNWAAPASNWGYGNTLGAYSPYGNTWGNTLGGSYWG